MFKGIPYSNKIVKRREEQRIQNIHRQNLKNIKPITTYFQIPLESPTNPFIHNKKKQMLLEDRFTEIERQNRMLLEKINSIMTKSPTFKVDKTKGFSSVHSDKQKMNKSLNQGFRKKQMQYIEVQNAKLLKRIMDKKSDYEAQRLQEEWKKQKQVIKNITNYPFIIRDKICKGRRKSTTSYSLQKRNFAPPLAELKKALTDPVKLMKIKKLGDSNFVITINYDGQKLVIFGDNKSKKQIKVIEIPKQEAIEFIEFECDGKIDLLFDCLRYNEVDGDLYLVGKGVEIDDKNQQSKEKDVVIKSQRKVSRIARDVENVRRGENKVIEEVKDDEIETQRRNRSEVKDNQDEKEMKKTEGRKEVNITQNEIQYGNVISNKKEVNIVGEVKNEMDVSSAPENVEKEKSNVNDEHNESKNQHLEQTLQELNNHKQEQLNNDDKRQISNHEQEQRKNQDQEEQKDQEADQQKLSDNEQPTPNQVEK